MHNSNFSLRFSAQTAQNHLLSPDWRSSPILELLPFHPGPCPSRLSQAFSGPEEPSGRRARSGTSWTAGRALSPRPIVSWSNCGSLWGRHRHGRSDKPSTSRRSWHKARDWFACWPLLHIPRGSSVGIETWQYAGASESREQQLLGQKLTQSFMHLNGDLRKRCVMYAKCLQAYESSCDRQWFP